MEKKLFDELLQSLSEAREIALGLKQPSRQFKLARLKKKKRPDTKSLK